MNSSLQILLTGLLIACLPVGLIVYGRALRQIATRGGRVRPDALGIPDALITLVLGGFFVFSAAQASREKTPDATPITTDAIVGSVSIFLIFVGVLMGFLALRKIDAIRLFGLRLRPRGMLCILGAGFLLAAAPVVIAVSAVVNLSLGGKADEQAMIGFFRHAVAMRDWNTVGLVAAVGAVFQPAVEEILFRGYFYASGKRFVGGLASAVICAVLFAAAHDTLAGMLPLLTLALCFTIAFEATGSLLVPFVMHVLFNSSQLAFLFWMASAAPPP